MSALAPKQSQPIELSTDGVEPLSTAPQLLATKTIIAHNPTHALWDQLMCAFDHVGPHEEHKDTEILSLDVAKLFV